MANTALIFREETLLHDTGAFHPESPDRPRAILAAFEQAELQPRRLDVEPAQRKDILRVHTGGHIDMIEKVCSFNMPYPDPDTVMGKNSWPAALLSAGGAIAGCKAILEKKCDNAFSIMRPPGHHAERDHAMGFCLFNNVAIAARWLQDEGGLKKIAILDWDVHHGNGTQHAFYQDDTVYYASLHQHPHYPGTGYPEERGKNNTNLNIQMPPGCAPEEWIAALSKLVLPELEAFDPDFLLISCGFDGHRLDPLGRQLLEAAHYAEMTSLVKSLASGRVLSLLEGGYHLQALGDCAIAHYQSLSEL